MSETILCQPSSSGRAKAAEEVLAEIRSDLLECKVCFERFSSEQNGRRPRNLPCGHVICLGCVCALAHPILRQLECPFCRRMCDVGGTYDCKALLDLQDMIGSSRYSRNTVGSGVSCLALPLQARADGLGSGSGSGSGSGLGIMRLRCTFGGWGSLINPTGVAILGPSMTTVVVHGGHDKVTIFNPLGQYLHSFARYGHSPSQLCHPLDVAVSQSGHIVVTDTGDSSVKIFSSNGTYLATISGPFKLPWGVDLDNCGHILVTDAQAGTLWQIEMDFGRNVVLGKMMVLQELQCPRAVASCNMSGRIALLEHLQAQKSHNADSIPTRLKLFSKDFVLLTQVDSFSLNLMISVKLNISYFTFDRKGGVIVADSQQGLIWSLGDLQTTPTLCPLVKDGLVRPVSLVVTEQNSLIVLDAGDHTVKIYSASSDDSCNVKRSK